MSIFSIYALTISLCLRLIKPIYPTFLIFIILLLILLSWYTKTQLSTSIVTVFLSFSISYISFAISTVIIAFFVMTFFNKNIHIFCQLICLFVQLIIVQIPFKTKRLKKGMPFLKRKIYAIPGSIISLIVILFATILNSYHYDTKLLIILGLLFISALLIYDYWRSCLTKTYIDKLKDRSISDLNQQIAQQAEEIIQLKEENQRLSKIVHKDNKLIPTLEHSVYTFIRNNSIKDQDVLTESDKIIERFSRLSKERAELVKEQDTLCQKLSLTNVLSIDQYLLYFQCQAKENNIDFQTVIDCDIPHLIETIIEEYDLETLIQDLLDDALHATQANNGCYILLSMGLVSNIYTISIFDSGIPFPTEVLSKWGLEQITTRREDGGSGIGMMNTYETLHKYNASFIIHELGTDNHTFTKEITISFNNKNQFILHTNRSEEDLIQLTNRADLQIIKHV